MYAKTLPYLMQPVALPMRRAAEALLARLSRGSLSVRWPEGGSAVYTGAAPGPVADIQVHTYRAVRRLFTGADMGFAQSYMDGDWDSGNVAAVIELAARNHGELSGSVHGSWALRALNRAAHGMRRNSRRGARRNIAAHYDLGNAFYARWLDPTLTYSGAVFGHDGESLAAAQTRKYARLAAQAGVRADHHVLEIGCGWGGFCTWAAATIGCRVTAVTISRAQYQHTLARVAAAGLGDLVDVRLDDYRDITGQYDSVVAIEMLEAVGEAYWPAFFAALRARLAPGGRAGLQVITIADALFPAYRRRADFVQRHIFPGGMLPSPTRLREAAAGAGLTWLAESRHGADYARTLAHWRANFEGAWPEIATLGFDERFQRKWRYYLAYCEAGFLAGRVDMVQLALRRDGDGP